MSEFEKNGQQAVSLEEAPEFLQENSISAQSVANKNKEGLRDGDKVHIVPSFHYDVAYEQTFETYKNKSFLILDKALEMLERHPDYTFTIEQTILAEAYCRKYPERVEEMRRFISEGRLHFAPGMYVMPDINLPDGESFCLQAEIGFEWLNENFSLQPEVCWIADCWGHHAQLPQLIQHCGFKYYAFWRCMKPSMRKNHFLWQGIDGTQLKTYWISHSYGAVLFPSADLPFNESHPDYPGCSAARIKRLCREAKAIGSGGSLLLCNGGDFIMPQQSAPDTIASLRQSGEFDEIGFSDMKNYLDSLEWENDPVQHGEFNSSFQGTFSTNIIIKQLTRECAMLFLGLERLSLLSGRPVKEGRKLLKTILKQQFHDIICGTMADDPLFESCDELQEAKAELLGRFAGKPADAKDLPQLFNPTQFDRTEIISDGKDYFQAELKAHSITGSETFRPLQSRPAGALPARFENSFYTAEIGVDGFITSLKTSSDSPELVREDTNCPFGALVQQIDYGDNWLLFDGPLNGGSKESSFVHNDEDPLVPRDSDGLIYRGPFMPEIKTAEIVFDSPELLIVKQKGRTAFCERMNISYETEIIFRADSPRIDYKTTAMPTGRHYRILAAFPAAIDEGEIYHEIPFGVQKRDRATHAAQNWMDFSTSGHGLTLLNKGLPSNTVDEKGNMFLTPFRSVDMDYKVPSSGSFWDGKEQFFEYSVMPHTKRDFAEFTKQGLLLNCPPVRTDFPAFDAGNFVCNRPEIIISGLRNTKQGVFIRLYECSGQPVNVSMQVPLPLKSFTIVDGQKNPLEESRSIAADGLKLEFKPFEIKALLLQ